MSKLRIMDEYSFDHFIDTFDYENPSIARDISNTFKKIDLEDFYYRLLSKTQATKNATRLTRIVELIWCLHAKKRLIPGESGIILSDAIFQLKDFSKIMIEKMHEVKNADFRLMCIELLYNYEDFFNEEEMTLIENFIVEEDHFLISATISNRLNRPGLEHFVKKILNTGNKYLIWGIMQYFIETIEPTLLTFMEDLRKMEDPVILNRVERYQKMFELNETLRRENRYDYSEDEIAFIEKDVLDYNDFYISIIDPKTREYLSKDEIEIKLRELHSELS